jgi:hypothetical protein
MNRFRFRGTAILAVGPTGILPVESTVTATIALRKSQTLSGESRKLSTASRESLRRKIQTAFGKLAKRSCTGRPLKKVRTLSAQFKVTKLSTLEPIAQHSGVILLIRELLTPDFRWFLLAHRRMPRTVGTVSPQFKALLAPLPGGAG